ncbi:MAG: aspartate carbamoyltransferase regulatory subunit [Clostridiales bacterium]|nr:aspartate carbamoyltransferase regulatory subunit [Clostridiales bacterium]
MQVDSIKDGLVIDHVAAGKSMDIYHYLKLDDMDCVVAIIKNVRSQKLGRKDVLKIEDPVDIDLDVLGYIDPNITVNIVRNGVIVDKKKLSLPNEITNVVKCKNPRCVTSSENYLPQLFTLADAETRTYRCRYCEQKA